jgi:hypothetical protein
MATAANNEKKEDLHVEIGHDLGNHLSLFHLLCNQWKSNVEPHSSLKTHAPQPPEEILEVTFADAVAEKSAVT